MQIKFQNCEKKLHLNFTVSGSIKRDILMSPETGNFFKSVAQFTVSGSIKLSHSMSPETGNKELKQK